MEFKAVFLALVMFLWYFFFNFCYNHASNRMSLFCNNLQERGHSFYDGMTKEQFAKMQKFIASRSSKPNPPSKL